MSTVSRSIFIDSDAFVAFVKKDDSLHGKVKKIFQNIESQPVVFYTSNYVFAECVTVISQRIGRETALQFVQSFKSKESVFKIIWVTEEIEEKALDIFKKQTSKNVSFVDCTNMAVVETENFDSIFSFDDVYRKNGFSTL